MSNIPRSVQAPIGQIFNVLLASFNLAGASNHLDFIYTDLISDTGWGVVA